MRDRGVKSHPIARAFVAGLLQGTGERHKDAAMVDAGERLAIRSTMAAASAIGFTGTRRGMTRAQQNSLRSLLMSGSWKLHHGDCVGADEQAHDIAASLGRAVAIHPASLPDQRAFKSAQDIRSPKPPLVRNKVIVRETDLLIAAPAEPMEQHRSGTWSTVRFARKMGRAICIIRPDGTLIRELGGHTGGQACQM